MPLARGAAIGEPTSPTPSTNRPTGSASRISPRSCAFCRRRTRTGSWAGRFSPALDGLEAASTQMLRPAPGMNASTPLTRESRGCLGRARLGRAGRSRSGRRINRGGVLAPVIRRPQQIFDLPWQLSGSEPGWRRVEMLDHGEARDFASQVRVEEFGIVAERHASIRLAVRAQHVGMGEDARTTVHPAAIDRVEPDGANAMKQSLAQREIVDIRRRRSPHPQIDMARIVDVGAEAGMSLEPPAVRQVYDTRGDVVDRGTAVVLDRCDLLADLGGANMRFGDRRLRRRIGPLRRR